MARTCLPTRAEFTYAAMGARAELVMLNRGANITATVRTLWLALNDPALLPHSGGSLRLLTYSRGGVHTTVYD
jgi:hypothetical protein